MVEGIGPVRMLFSRVLYLLVNEIVTDISKLSNFQFQQELNQ
jgi:hypothetical protein